MLIYILFQKEEGVKNFWSGVKNFCWWGKTFQIKEIGNDVKVNWNENKIQRNCEWVEKVVNKRENWIFEFDVKNEPKIREKF